MKMTPAIVLRWTSAIMLAMLIYALSVTDQRRETGQMFPGSALTFHFLAYGALAFVLCRAMKDPASVKAPLRILVTAALVATLYGAFIEAVQSQISFRNASLLDALANALGAMVAVIVYRLLSPHIRSIR